MVDLDIRQQSTGHFFANRAAWTAAHNAALPAPDMRTVGDEASLAEALSVEADFVLIDTPGADTELSRAAHRVADLVVTPMNDSFVDFRHAGRGGSRHARSDQAQPLF